MMMEKVYIIILNYNGWVHTIECLESIFKNEYDNYEVIVIDNDSKDNSLDYIKRWAQGQYILNFDMKVKQIEELVQPFIRKPLPYFFYTQDQVSDHLPFKESNSQRKPLVIIQSKDNLGYAGGNNLGIKYALKKGDAQYAWILNNDTVIEKESLRELVNSFRTFKKQSKKVGILGNKSFFYYDPDTIQGFGGRYNKWAAIGRHIGAFEKDHGQYDQDDLRADYVLGSSMFVDMDFVKDVGLMSEDYFLYFEELDWALRGKKNGWRIGFSYKSKIYHKEGAALGTSQKGEKRSIVSDYYALRNRIVFTKKFYPYALLTVYLSYILVFYNRIKRKQFKSIKLIWKALLNQLDLRYTHE